MVLEAEEVPRNRGKTVHFGRELRRKCGWEEFLEWVRDWTVEEVLGICGKMVHFGREGREEDVRQ